MKFIVLYETKFGNTKLVAEKIAAGIKEIDPGEVLVDNIRNVNIASVSEYDVILIGGPTHFGTSTRTVNKLIDRLGKLDLSFKWIAVFSTYIKGDTGKGVMRMEERIREKVPDSKLISPGLSIDVGGIKGPVLKDELPKCIEFGRNIAGQLVSAVVSSALDKKDYSFQGTERIEV